MDVDIGKAVQKDELIARIDDEIIRLSLDQARAQLINTSATYEKAQKDLERFLILLEKDQISEGEFETNRVQHELAKAAFLTAEAGVKSAERQLRNTHITSPIGGAIAEKIVQKGTMVSVGQPIVKVVDISTIKVNINLSEQDVVNIKTGMPVEVKLDGFPGRTFSGSVFAVSPEANSETHTFPVEIIVPNDQGPEVKSGMIARVSINTDVLKNATLIPRDAVVERYGRLYVYTVQEGGSAHEHEVKLGRESGSEVQVIEGIRTGEQVIVVGQFNLEDGVPIRIRR